MFTRKLILIIILSALLAACGSPPAPGNGNLRVVASTTILGDVVARVGGEHIDLTVLFPTGADPHTFDPRPQDIAAVSEADVIVISGLGLEESLEPALDASAAGPVVHASQGIEVLALEDDGHEGEEHAGEDEHEYEDGDPHTWTDPNNVIVWTENIAAALSEADPEHASTYQANAEAYIASLRDLDAWIRSKTAQIPPESRKLVTDHRSFSYFAYQYGFEQTGALVGSFSTNASPSAQEIAALEDLILAQDVSAVFVGKTVNPALAQQISVDTGVELVFIYTGSLTAPGGEADTYLAFMKYNVNAIVEALK